LSHSKSRSRERSKQIDSGRGHHTVTVTGLERASVTPVRHQQLPDHSNAANASTPSKYGLFLEDAPFLEVPDLMKHK